MTSIMPRPLKDFIVASDHIHKAVSDFIQLGREQPGSAQAELSNSNILDKKLSDNAIIKSLVIQRITLAALACLALYYLGGSLAIASTIGLVISVPVVAIAAGAGLLFNAVTAVIAALATGSFAALFYGIGLGLVGWLVLEKYDIMTLGLAEPIFKQNAVKYAESVRKNLIV